MTPSKTRPPRPTPALHLARWTVTSGSNVQSRGAVVIEAGDHHWRASAEGNGAVDALFKAVDARPRRRPRGPPAARRLRRPRARRGPGGRGPRHRRDRAAGGGEGARGEGLYNGKARSTNIIAASIEAYIEALNAMLAEAHWAGAAETAGKGRRRAAEHHGRRGELDKDADDSIPWVG